MTDSNYFGFLILWIIKNSNVLLYLCFVELTQKFQINIIAKCIISVIYITEQVNFVQDVFFKPFTQN